MTIDDSVVVFKNLQLHGVYASEFYISALSGALVLQSFGGGFITDFTA